jgi:predicted transglutaminase-like cysteine proteinase
VRNHWLRRLLLLTASAAAAVSLYLTLSARAPAPPAAEAPAVVAERKAEPPPESPPVAAPLPAPVVAVPAPAQTEPERRPGPVVEARAKDDLEPLAAVPAPPTAAPPTPLPAPPAARSAAPAKPRPQEAALRAEPPEAKPEIPWPRLFGTAETRSDNLRPFTKWTWMLDRYAKEHTLDVAPCAQLGALKCRPKVWRDWLATLEGKPRRQQVELVNAYMNQRAYIEDLPNYGVPDYWATPREFLGKDGDCEDYAIAKYMSLRTLGFAESELRVVVLQDVNLGVPHAVLVVQLDGQALLLDNQIKTVIDQSRVRHYRPYYSINERHWWLHKAAVAQDAAAGGGAKPN